MSPNVLLWLITGCLMMQPLSTDLYLPSLPHLAREFAVTPAAVQQTLSLFVLGFGGAQLISGPLSDRYGRKPVLLSGLVVYVLATMACGFAPSLPLLVAARFLQAIGCCTAVVVARAIVRDSYSPAEGARVIAKASSLLSFAPIVGPIAGGYLQVFFGWRAAFVILTLYGILMLVAAVRWLRETNTSPNPDAARPAHVAATYRQVLSNPAFWAYSLPGALSYGGIFIFISGSSFVFISVLGVSTQFYGVLFALGVLGYLMGTLICRRLIAIRGVTKTLALGTTVGICGGFLFLALTLAGIQHWTVVLLALFTTMTAHGINFPCAQSGSVAPFPDRAGAAAGLFGAIIMSAAFGIGTWVGASHDGTVLPLAFITVTVTSLMFVVTRVLRPYGQLG